MSLVSEHIEKCLLAGPDAAFTPPLPRGWDDASEEDFYARTGPKAQAGGGIFAAWAKRAMGAPFVCPVDGAGAEACGSR